MVKILAIGNSFSQDATTYLYDIAKADNVNLKVVNLCIGGCSLETHWDNAINNYKKYQYELNGHATDKFVSIYDALVEDDWDYVTLQQVSHYSGILETYFPYIKDLSTFITKYVPFAQQLIHQTWAYEVDSNHGCYNLYNNNQNEMYLSLINAYESVAKELSLQIIPCGEVIQSLRKNKLFDYQNGGLSLCRDGFHMDLLYGRYAVAATWYETLVKNNILDNNYIPCSISGVATDVKYIELIKNTVHNVVSANKYNY